MFTSIVLKAMRQLAHTVARSSPTASGLAWLPARQQPCRLVCHASGASGSRSPLSGIPGQAAANTTHTTASAQAAAAAAVEDVDWLARSRLLVGDDGLARLQNINVLIVGLGGVGGFAAEFLCRAGVGAMTIVDGDEVDPSNRNRQVLALRSTQGHPKARVLAQRLLDINPALKLTEVQSFLTPETAGELVSAQRYSYVVDCIDSIAPKQHLLLAAVAAGLPAISSMGAGGRLDPSMVKVADISQTYNDPFAASIRRGLRKHGVKYGVTVVFSEELARRSSLALTRQQFKRSYFGTVSYIPALFGLHIASHVVRDVVDRDYHSAQLRLASRLRKQERRQRYLTSTRGSSISSTNSSGVSVSSLDEANDIKPLPMAKGSKQGSHTGSKAGGRAPEVVNSSSSSSKVLPAEDEIQARHPPAAAPAGSVSTSQLSHSHHASSKGSGSQQSKGAHVAGTQPPLLASFEQAEGEGVGFDGSGI